MQRNIAIFIDGTWNRSGSRYKTNVQKLFEATAEGVLNGCEQSKLYISGVGTRPRVEASKLDSDDYSVELWPYLSKVSTPVFTQLVGGATGLGTAARIQATYHYLCKKFRPQSSDKIFMFGFSRGAFAARSLAGFIDKVGLLFAEKLEHVQCAYEIYENSKDANQLELSDFLYQLTGRRFVNEEEEFYVPTHFLGVWDTVGALGLPGRMKSFTAPYTEYHQVECPPSIMIARHALALHELRSAFKPLLWQSASRGNMKQVWFSGAHADVGGGYPEGEDGYSDIALKWMVSEAEENGLVISSSAICSTPSAQECAIHHEIRGWFLTTKPTLRSWLFEENHACCERHQIHESTLDYILNSDKVRYKFKTPRVNSALQRVDALALQRAVVLAMMKNGEEDYSISIKHGWWCSVTPSELRESRDLVNAFLNGERGWQSSEIEAFARALALRQLFDDSNAVRDVAEKMANLMLFPEYARDSKDAVNCLARHQAFVDGLNHCSSLLELEPQGELCNWQIKSEYACIIASINRVRLQASLAYGGLELRARSDEAHAEELVEIRERSKVSKL